MLRYNSSNADSSDSSKCCDRVVYATGKSPVEELRNYYRIIFALARGAGPGGRRGLPLELVTYIYQYAGFTSPNPNKALSDHLRCQRFESIPSPPEWVRKPSFSKVTNMVLLTSSISMQALQALGKVEVVAKRARDRRRASPGHWNNFVIKINRSVDSQSGSEEHSVSDIEWSCFEEASKKKSDERRLVINQCHEIWSFFKPGDRLEVGLKDYPWVCPEKHYEVSVRVWDLWEPSPKVLALA
ncbi:hypothetical protein FRC07_000736 [Ceratobasidium sp. 392]|nr:hypothetical protein FRC07_000736 [Ceratobasidium sp. 392]